MTQAENTREAALLEEAITVLFCEIDDTYRHLNPNGQLYESLKRLSDPEVITLALFQQLRGVGLAAPSCAKSPASSPTSSPAWSALFLPLFIAASASSGDSSNP